MTEIDVIELSDFMTMLDNIVEDLKSGKTKANPLFKPEAVKAVDGSGTTVATTSIEGIESVGEDSEDVKPEIIGRPGKVLVVLVGADSEIIYGSAAVAARELGVNATTVRDRCKGEKVDKNGKTWTYRDKTEVGL